MWYAGIDEAGYGPTLGPLCIACVRVQGRSEALSACAQRAGWGDSKRVHAGGRLDRLEAVALPALTWLCGWQPNNAAEASLLLSDDPALYDSIPWLAPLRELSLPVAANTLPEVAAHDLEPLGLSGAVVHPRQLNAAKRAGVNRAQVEVERIAGLIAALPLEQPGQVLVDRLSGRRYYHAPLAAACGLERAETVHESPACSRYRVGQADIAFAVKADAQFPLVGLASCLAKYLRELHMLAFNRYWGSRLPWLAPTAGYPEDAARWLHQLGTGLCRAYGDDLIRGWTAEE